MNMKYLIRELQYWLSYFDGEFVVAMYVVAILLARLVRSHRLLPVCTLAVGVWAGNLLEPTFYVPKPPSPAFAPGPCKGVHTPWGCNPFGTDTA